MYVQNSGNNWLRKLLPQGVVSTQFCLDVNFTSALSFFVSISIFSQTASVPSKCLRKLEMCPHFQTPYPLVALACFSYGLPQWENTASINPSISLTRHHSGFKRCGPFEGLRIFKLYLLIVSSIGTVKNFSVCSTLDFNFLQKKNNIDRLGLQF
jgi:hypothetical protein